MRNAVQLITYVDRLAGDLSGVAALLNNELAGLFGGVHLLPYFTPFDGADAGFDPADHLLVDSRLGDWAALEQLSEQIYVMSDVIVNHVSHQSRRFQDVMRNGDKSQYWDMFLKRSDVFGDVADSDVADSDVAGNSAVDTEVKKVYRPRPGSPFTNITLDDGTSHDFWTTFSPQQLDINVESPAGRSYLESILAKFEQAGVRGVRLDAAGYAIKRYGTSCFMLPETFEFLGELQRSASQRHMDVLVEIHAYYQTQVAIAERVSMVYDFALPPLVLHTLYSASAAALKSWLSVSPRNCVNVLDTHDGIGIVDVARSGKLPGLLTDEETDVLVTEIHHRTNGESQLASGQAASNLDIYQINTTFYDALGRSDNLYLLARAIQFFAPGVPQVYYVGLLAQENDTDLLAKSGVGRDINRHYFTPEEIQAAVVKPVVASLFKLIRLRNSASAFAGELEILESADNCLELGWSHEGNTAQLSIDLQKSVADITIIENGEIARYHIADTLRAVTQ